MYCYLTVVKYINLHHPTIFGSAYACLHSLFEMHDVQINDRLQRGSAKCNFTVLLHSLTIPCFSSCSRHSGSGLPAHRAPLAHNMWQLITGFFLPTRGGGAKRRPSTEHTGRCMVAASSLVVCKCERGGFRDFFLTYVKFFYS
jgi:hypothetical protein